MITRSCDWSYCARSGLLSPKILVRLSSGGVGVGVGVGFGVGLAARAATGDAPVGPLSGAEHAAERASSSTGAGARRFKGRQHTPAAENPPASAPGRFSPQLPMPSHA